MIGTPSAAIERNHCRKRPARPFGSELEFFPSKRAIFPRLNFVAKARKAYGERRRNAIREFHDYHDDKAIGPRLLRTGRPGNRSCAEPTTSQRRSGSPGSSLAATDRRCSGSPITSCSITNVTALRFATRVADAHDAPPAQNAICRQSRPLRSEQQSPVTRPLRGQKTTIRIHGGSAQTLQVAVAIVPPICPACTLDTTTTLEAKCRIASERDRRRPSPAPNLPRTRYFTRRRTWSRLRCDEKTAPGGAVFSHLGCIFGLVESSTTRML